MTDIEKFISIPLAIKVLQHDKVQFQRCKIHSLYENLIDSVVKEMQTDLNQIGYQKVKRVSQTDYIIDGELVEYDPVELRQLTSELVREYFYKVKVEFVDKAWIN